MAPRKTVTRRNKRKGGTRKQRGSNSMNKKYSSSTLYSNSTKSVIVRTFLEMLNIVKLYHWRTKSYAQHKATDELYANLNEHIDSFVEVLLGKDQSRVTMMEDKCRKFNEAKTTHDIESRMNKYKRFLIDELGNIFSNKADTDLLNIRDEILGDINQFLYLLSLNK